jgi:hypothetical protein
MWWSILLIATMALLLWFFWLRPILRRQPELKDLWAREDRFVEALRLKFAGLKERLFNAIVVGSSAIVLVHDEIAEVVTNSGIDVTPISSRVPSTVWLALLIALPLTMRLFRWLADKRHAAEMAELKNETGG